MTDGAFRVRDRPDRRARREGGAEALRLRRGDRPTRTLDALAKLKPVLRPEERDRHGGNAPASPDGASAMLVMSAERAKSLGLAPMAKVKGMASVGVDPSIMGYGRSRP